MLGQHPREVTFQGVCGLGTGEVDVEGAQKLVQRRHRLARRERYSFCRLHTSLYARPRQVTKPYYATAYVTRTGQRFTVALARVTKGQPLQEVIRELLRQAARAGVRPRYLLLDRGFCSVGVLRYLQRARYPFLMPLVLRGRKADHPQGPSASRVFAAWKRSGWGRYTLTSGKKGRATVSVCVKCRNRRGERGRRGREALVYAYGGGR